MLQRILIWSLGLVTDLMLGAVRFHKEASWSALKPLKRFREEYRELQTKTSYKFPQLWRLSA